MDCLGTPGFVVERSRAARQIMERALKCEVCMEKKIIGKVEYPAVRKVSCMCLA